MGSTWDYLHYSPFWENGIHGDICYLTEEKLTTHTPPHTNNNWNNDVFSSMIITQIRIHFRRTSMWRFHFVMLDSIWRRDFSICGCLDVRLYLNAGRNSFQPPRCESHYFRVALLHCLSELSTPDNAPHLSGMSPFEECCWCNNTWPEVRYWRTVTSIALPYLTCTLPGEVQPPRAHIHCWSPRRGLDPLVWFQYFALDRCMAI